MGAIVTAQANFLLNASLVQTPATAATTGIKMRLGSTIGTATSAMTELTGTGYTSGGTACAFGAASSGSSANTGAPSWTNGSGSSWTIEGIELWDQAGTPLRWWYGSWTGQPITVANGNTFAVAASAVTCSLS
jgi:hypothetical protein